MENNDTIIDNDTANREKNKKTLKIVGAVIAGIIVLSVIGGGSSKNSSNNTIDTNYTTTTEMYQYGPNWNDWTSGFSPVWQKFYADWNATLADLSNADAYAARQDFAQLSHDAAEISTWSSSPDSAVNSWVDSLANDVNSLAYEGVQSLNNIDAGGDITPGFTSSADAVKADISGLTSALEAATGTSL